jgi:hypothetical protein
VLEVDVVGACVVLELPVVGGLLVLSCSTTLDIVGGGRGRDAPTWREVVGAAWTTTSSWAGAAWSPSPPARG